MNGMVDHGYSHDAFMANLVSLPAELLIKIFANVPNEQLKALSLRCKTMAPIAHEMLFHTLTVAPRKSRLRALKHVANHPDFRLHVKHLSYDLSSYRHYKPIDGPTGHRGTQDYFFVPATDWSEYRDDDHKYTTNELRKFDWHTRNLIHDELEILHENLIPRGSFKNTPKLQEPEAGQLLVSIYRYISISSGSPSSAANANGFV